MEKRSPHVAKGNLRALIEPCLKLSADADGFSLYTASPKDCELRVISTTTGLPQWPTGTPGTRIVCCAVSKNHATDGRGRSALVRSRRLQDGKLVVPLRVRSANVVDQIFHFEVAGFVVENMKPAHWRAVVARLRAYLSGCSEAGLVSSPPPGRGCTYRRHR